MKHVFSALIVGVTLAAAQAHACDYPAAPGKFPDGSVASKEEMLAAKGQVVKYNSEMDAYLACIKGEYDAKVAGLTKPTKEQLAEIEKVQAQKQDAALKEVTDVTERFNEQLRAWKAKNVPEKKPS
jgi:uncharacterized protein YecT (DUF1311 family)